MDEELKTFLDNDIRNLTNESVAAIAPLADIGEVNEVFLVTTKNKRFVARVHVAGEFPRFKKEEWCISHALKVGVKTPKSLSVHQHGDYAYMLMEYVIGSRADKDDINREMVWQAIGQYANQIHSIKISGFGENLHDLLEGSFSRWNDYLSYNIKNLNDEDKLLLGGIITKSQSTQIKTYFEELSKVSFNFGLSHGDLSLQNTIVDRNNEVNLIDWGSAEGHITPHYDLGVVLTDSLSDDSNDFANVLKGYGLSWKDYEAMREEIKSLMLLIATDKIRWALDRSAESLDSAIKHFNKVLEWKTIG
jgi:aminoglycoside phosphotransferase (APT) family kinase protein